MTEPENRGNRIRYITISVFENTKMERRKFPLLSPARMIAEALHVVPLPNIHPSSDPVRHHHIVYFYLETPKAPMKIKPQNPRPVAVSIATVANKLDVRVGIVKQMIRSGVLLPIRTKLMIFDPRQTCLGVISQSSNPVLVSRAQVWLSKLESEPQLIAVSTKQKKRRTRKKIEDQSAN